MLAEEFFVCRGEALVTLEDNPEYRGVVQEVTEKRGYTVYAHDTYDEVFDEMLSLFEKDQIVTFFLDIALKEARKGGVKACLAIDRASRKYGFIPLISFVSSNIANEEDTEMLYNAGAKLLYDKTDEAHQDAEILVEQDVLERVEILNGRHNMDLERVNKNNGKLISSTESEIKNKKELDRLLSNQEWYKSHIGKYIAIIGGELVSEEEDLTLLIESMPSGNDGALVHHIGEGDKRKVFKVMSHFKIKKKS